MENRVLAFYKKTGHAAHSMLYSTLSSDQICNINDDRKHLFFREGVCQECGDDLHFFFENEVAKHVICYQCDYIIENPRIELKPVFMRWRFVW